MRTECKPYYLPLRNYDEMRGGLRLGDIIFTRDESRVSRGIRAGTCGEFSHVGAVLWDTMLDNIDRVICVESLSNGPQFSFLSDILWRFNKPGGHVVIARPKGFDAGLQFKRALLDGRFKPYDWSGALRSALPWGLHDLELEKLFCSEYVALAFQASGHFKELDDRVINPSGVTPADLWRWDMWYKAYELRLDEGTSGALYVSQHNTLRFPLVQRGRWFWKHTASLAVPSNGG
jgi:hypothetical protein